MIPDIAKILFVLGLVFIVVKASGRRPAGTYNGLYVLHKAGAGLATILAFVDGLTYVPLSQTYVITGWVLGMSMLALFATGVFLGFKSDWVPFGKEEDAQFRSIRVMKWLLTAMVIVAIATHYLLM